MPPIIAAIAGAIALIAPFIVRYIIIGLGISVVTFVGADMLLSGLQTYVANSFAGLPADVAVFLSLAEVDTACSMIISAYAARLAIKVTFGFSVVRFAQQFPGN